MSGPTYSSNMAHVDEKHAVQPAETSHHEVTDKRSDEEHLYESDHEVPVRYFDQCGDD